MELDVNDREDWKTLRSETFMDGRQLIMKQYGRDFQILLMDKNNCELAEIIGDFVCAHARFNVLIELIK